MAKILNIRLIFFLLFSLLATKGIAQENKTNIPELLGYGSLAVYWSVSWGRTATVCGAA
jgi:hypothetical protein